MQMTYFNANDADMNKNKIYQPYVITMNNLFMMNILSIANG